MDFSSSFSCQAKSGEVFRKSFLIQSNHRRSGFAFHSSSFFLFFSFLSSPGNSFVIPIGLSAVSRAALRFLSDFFPFLSLAVALSFFVFNRRIVSSFFFSSSLSSCEVCGRLAAGGKEDIAALAHFFLSVVWGQIGFFSRSSSPLFFSFFSSSSTIRCWRGGALRELERERFLFFLLVFPGKPTGKRSLNQRRIRRRFAHEKQEKRRRKRRLGGEGAHDVRDL